MSHDIHADWAGSELCRVIEAAPSLCFTNPPPNTQLSASATRVGRGNWPIPDGHLTVTKQSSIDYDIALEFKRPNEGLHGVLTALGQAHAYIEKKYSGAVIVIPARYDTYPNPGEKLDDILTATNPQQYIAVFKYDDPDPSQTSPFHGKLQCVRSFKYDFTQGPPTNFGGAASNRRSETQWGHFREGEISPDFFYQYLLIAEEIEAGRHQPPQPTLPPELITAVQAAKAGAVPVEWLSKSEGGDFHDLVWRSYWYKFVFHPNNYPIWQSNAGGTYVAASVDTMLTQADGKSPVRWFGSRVRGPICAQLNSGQLTEQKAWYQWASKIRKRAHSAKQNLDSSLEHMGFIDDSGRPTEIGRRFVRASGKYGCFSGIPRAIIRAAVLKNGGFATLLHYVFRLSEERFTATPLAFSQITGPNAVDFDQRKYLRWLESEMADNLHVLRKVSSRSAANPRLPFQAELVVLRQLGLVKEEPSCRTGVGLVINWPAVQEALDSDLG